MVVGHAGKSIINYMMVTNQVFEQRKLPTGATIAPVIITSDKTQLSNFSGDKSVWPVYLTIGNIEKSTRRMASLRATVLIGYIPVSKLECFSEKRRQHEASQLWHSCMRSLLRPLMEVGKNGVQMVCPDQKIHWVFLILFTYVADHLEQCLVACNKQNCCLRCKVGRLKLGDGKASPAKTQKEVLEAMERACNGDFKKFNELGLHPIDPFWRDLPHCDIFSCFTPDLLHQLHKGVFKDHVATWAIKCLANGKNEVDICFRAMPRGADLRHFKQGISFVSQWTGNKYKNMEKVFLGVLAGKGEPGLISAVRSLLDFIYYVHFESHSHNSLCQLNDAYIQFHKGLEYFADKGIRDDFDLPKLHSMQHYISSIISRGSADGYNTEASKRLHIDYTKKAY